MSDPNKSGKSKSLAELALERKQRETQEIEQARQRREQARIEKEETERERQRWEQARLERERREAEKNAEKLHYSPPDTTDLYSEPLYMDGDEKPKRVEVVHIHKTDKKLTVMSALMWPFAKLFEFFRYIGKIILEETLRGLVQLFFGVILLILTVSIAIFFFFMIVAYQEVGDIGLAFPRAFEMFMELMPF